MSNPGEQLFDLYGVLGGELSYCSAMYKHVYTFCHLNSIIIIIKKTRE